MIKWDQPKTHLEKDHEATCKKNKSKWRIAIAGAIEKEALTIDSKIDVEIKDNDGI